MAFHLRFLSALLLGAAIGFVAGCQTYDFEPVEPLGVSQTTQSKRVIARNAKPNIMLLVDKSGSMDFPIDPSNPLCPDKCGTGKAAAFICPANCPTRWSELQSAMAGFFTNNPTLARMGMTTYPENNCTPPTKVRVELSQSNDVDTELTAKTKEIAQSLAKIVSSGGQELTGGGTPTGASIRFVGNYEPLSDSSRENFILLLTDGLPNCNFQNKNSCSNPTACRCTLLECSPTSNCQSGCLDKDATVEEISKLRPKKIRTIVVGFGADTDSGDANETLNAMAEAGGFPLSCPNGTNAECGTGNTCNAATKTCNRRYYQAKNANELSQALVEITKLVANTNPCLYKLEEKPSDPRFLTVLIDGENVSKDSGLWKYDEAAGSVTFSGSICQSLENASVSNPVDVEFRMVQGL